MRKVRIKPLRREVKGEVRSMGGEGGWGEGENILERNGSLPPLSFSKPQNVGEISPIKYKFTGRKNAVKNQDLFNRKIGKFSISGC